VCGKPLVAWSILQARAAAHVGPVYVSSDNHEIGSVAKSYGATWIQRPLELSGDTATTETAVAHWLAQLDAEPSIVVLLQPTSPIRQSHDIDGAIARYKQADADSLFSARRVDGFTWQINGHVAANYDFGQRKRRQELTEHTIEENGSIYVFSPQSFRRHGNRLGGRVAWYEMHPLDSFQVDEPADLELMRELMHLRNLHAREAA